MKNENDVKILEALIREQNAAGARLPVSPDDRRYEWGEDGRLKKLYLSDCFLSGRLSLAGLDALESLNCSYNRLDALDISRNPALKLLICDRNSLTELDAGGAPALVTVYCSYNQLETLDVSRCGALEKLHCNNNRLETLDASGSPALKELCCYNNPLKMKTLDVSRNPELELFIHDAGVRVPEEDAEPDMEA